MIVNKIINVQSKLKAPKNQFNKFGGYNYRSQEDILEAVKPLLIEEGLLLSISDDLVITPTSSYVKSTVTVRSDDGDILETSAFAKHPDEQKGMADPQITGSTSSYARKYALNGMFCIDDNKDADFTNTHGKDTSATKTPPKSKAAPKAKPVSKNEDAVVDFMNRLVADYGCRSVDDINKILKELKLPNYDVLTSDDACDADIDALLALEHNTIHTVSNKVLFSKK